MCACERECAHTWGSMSENEKKPFFLSSVQTWQSPSHGRSGFQPITFLSYQLSQSSGNLNFQFSFGKLFMCEVCNLKKCWCRTSLQQHLSELEHFYIHLWMTHQYHFRAACWRGETSWDSTWEEYEWVIYHCRPFNYDIAWHQSSILLNGMTSLWEMLVSTMTHVMQISTLNTCVVSSEFWELETVLIH